MINPALSLRRELEMAYPEGMLRWDVSGRALLVSDGPRRGAAGVTLLKYIEKNGLPCQTEHGLLHVDCTGEAYEGLLKIEMNRFGTIDEAWFPIQTLLGGMLCRKRPGIHGADAVPEKSLLRAAMLACARGEKPVRDFAKRLRAADAEALRLGRTETTRACAALLAHWLWETRSVAPVKPVYGVVVGEDVGGGMPGGAAPWTLA